MTQREHEVLRLIAQGFTNAQIAERLSVGVDRGGTDAQALFNKLGVSSRTAATRVAIEQHLIS